MANAVNGVFIKLDTQNTHQPQATILPFATPKSGGAMSPEQAALLQELAIQSQSFLREVVQPADADDFLVTVPLALRVGTALYQPVCSIMTPGIFTGIAFDLTSQTVDTFRVTTDGTLPNGTLLLFSIRKVAP